MLHGGSLSGFVYFDADGDGTRDANEGGVPGIVVQLSNSDSSAAARDQSTLTDANGAYTFADLDPGTYQLTKRQSAATIDGRESTSAPGAVVGSNLVSNVVLGDEEALAGNNFGERGLRSEFTGIAWFFASSAPADQMLRETIALGEQAAGETQLAAAIRAGRTDVPDGTNGSPVATDDVFTVKQNAVLTIAASGVLANDTDPDGNALTASLVGQPAHGSVTLNSNGSFVYTPSTEFSGSDSFTYRANDGLATSNLATVRVTVIATDDVTNLPFDTVVPGPVDAPGLLGTRMDTQTGAPPVSQEHVTTAVDYSGFPSAPSYGQHHGAIAGITPRPTGVYTTAQPDEDLVHNLEHGHVWISYNPTLITSADRIALEKLVTDGGTDTGVILTPRAKNAATIVLTSWTRQLTLDSFNATTIRNFVNTNRGHAPEGFIPSGQNPANGETLSDGLPHTP